MRPGPRARIVWILTVALVLASGLPAGGAQTFSAKSTAATVRPVVGAFNATRAMQLVRALSTNIGVRQAGSASELRAAYYIRNRLREAGYTPVVRTFALPGGRRSQNVVATLPGSSARRVILGAHYDTKRPSPGANDNATGVAALLEIARELKDEKLTPTVEFVFFGSEETIDSNPNHHHYGSRSFVASMSAARRRATAGMLSVDMIGFGPELRVRTMGRGPQTLRRALLKYAAARGVGASYLRDPGKYGWSDHEPFELAGIPAAWIEWRDDPVYHTARDTTGHVSAAKVKSVGVLVLGYVRSLDAAALEALID